jgi:regulator of protease activity HflC (stomatin/prohibitin superfamily)
MSDLKSNFSSGFFFQMPGFLVMLLLLLCAVFLLGFWYTIETGEVGVKVRLGKYDMNEISPGLHFKWPIIEKIKKVDIRVRTINYVSTKAKHEITGRGGVLYGSPISVLDQRGLTVSVELTVQYQLKPQMVAEVLAQYGENYEIKLIHPIVRDAVRDIIAEYPAEEIPMKRNEIARRISLTIIKEVQEIKGNPFEVTAVQLRNIALPPRVAQKIQEVQLAKQEAEKMKALEEKAQREQRVRLIQAETLKQEQIKKAEAEKQQKILQAQAEAEARLLKAEAIAKANQKIAKSISPEVLRWRELAVQEKFAEAISQNPNVRLFYGMGHGGNLHFWIEETQGKSATLPKKKDLSKQ